MRRCCAAAMKAGGFRSTCRMMDAVATGHMANGPPPPRPTTKALRDRWKPNVHNYSMDTLCSVCHSFAAKPPSTHRRDETAVEIDIYNLFRHSIPPIMVASVIMGMLGQRVSVPRVTCTEVFECFAIIDKLGDEDRVAVERGMYELLYDSKDPSAAVLAYCVRPASDRRTAAPLVKEYLLRLVSSNDLRKTDTPPPSTDDNDTAEDVALKDYLRVLKQDEDAVCAVVSLIRAVPDRYKNRFDLLFAMRLETLLRACAEDVWSGVPDTTTTTAIDEMLEEMKSKPSSVVDAESSQTLTLSSDEITIDELSRREDWHPGFTKTFNSIETEFILESKQKNKDGETKRYIIYPGRSVSKRKLFLLHSDKDEVEPIQNFAHLAQMLQVPTTVPVPVLKSFDSSTVLLSGINFNAGIQGDLFPEMSGTIQQYMDLDPCMEQQLLKRHCTLVNGGSGTGKTVFSTMMLPQRMYTNPLVLHKVIKDDESELEEIARLDREYHDKLQNNKRSEMRHLFASCALRRRRENTPYADVADYPRWMEACSTILGENNRNEEAKKYVVKVLKELLGTSEKWVNKNDGVEKYDNTVILVIDELGKCLPLARAIISAQYNIYRDPWVCSHFAKLELVLCGTGTEMAVTPSSRFIATDPTSVNVITLLRPNPLFLDALFILSLLGTLGKDTLQATKSKAQSLYPILYSQYVSSSLFNDAKTNTRLYVQSCYFFRMIFNSINKDKAESPEEHDRKHAARMDSCFARTLGLDGCVRLAIQWFIRCNGLGRVRNETDRMAVDAALTSALQHVHPLIPLPPLYKDDALMEKAATLGLVVRRRSGEIPSAALTAVVTFGYTEPCAALEGYTQEQFTAEWASRLVEVQTGYAAPIVSLPFCLPWKDRRPPSADDIASLLQKLREHKALVLLNGPSAPGADVIVVQLRRSYEELKNRMSRETYCKLYPDGVAAIVTVISNKQRSRDNLQQGLTLGVVNIEQLMSSFIGTVTSATWRDACETERHTRGKAIELFSTLDTLLHSNGVPKGDEVESQMKTYIKHSTEYRNQLRYLSIVSTALNKNEENENKNVSEKIETGSEESKRATSLQSQLSALYGLKENDYHYAGPLFLGLLCVGALVPSESLPTEKLLSEEPDTLRSALVTALKEDVVVDAMRKMDGLKTDTSAVRVLVQPRFVCGDDPTQTAQREDWRKSVLSGDAFSWACAEDTTNWVCPPGSFGPLEKMIRVEESKKSSK